VIFDSSNIDTATRVSDTKYCATPNPHRSH
jgi:hypothetical protein